MCGIAGILTASGQSITADPDELLRVRDAMAPRGPNGAGVWMSDGRTVGLAHRRLAILDVSEAGAQPMVDHETGCVITYNGEIYNCRELREALARQGHRFRSTSDTEVLLRGYLEHGEAVLPMLQGMFAFCIWDPRSRRALLARDPLGIKPLYVSEGGGAVRFASQVKALIAGRGVRDLRPDQAARVGFCLWGHVPEPHTLCRGIRMLPAGSYAWVQDGKLSAAHAYFDLTSELAAGEVSGERTLSDAERARALREAVGGSVSAHLLSDVPVGVFLSAGIDSTAVASLASDARRGDPVRTLTVAFDEYRGSLLDESVLAEQVAGLIRAQHSTIGVTATDFAQQVDHALQAMDQPTIDGLNTYFVVKAARDIGLKVVLSGVGGDELFGGYGYYRRIPRLVRWGSVPARVPGLGKVARVLSRPIAAMLGKPKSASLLEMSTDSASAYLLRRGLMLPWELPSVLDPEAAAEGLAELNVFESMRRSIRGIRSVDQQVRSLDFTFYLRNQLLRDSDWASMAHSVELRTPLVDAWLLRDIMRLRTLGLRASKADFARAANPKIYELLQSRPKTGFSIPVTQWMPPELRATAGRANPYRIWAKYVLQRFEAG